LQKFILTLDVKESGVQELSYDLQDEKLRIFVTPKQGFLTRDAVRTAQTDFKYDLIVVLDSENLAALGGLYENNTELFYKTPIINIDHQAGNEHFGQVNLVDLTVVSTAEVVFDLLKQLGEEYIDAAVATAILTGLIAQTRSLKSDNIKPHTVATAAKLIGLGAEREKIITNRFRPRSVSALKLWGHALTPLQHDSKIGLVWSTITRDDFVRSGATETDLKDIIDELIGNSPEAKFTLLLHEHIEAPQTIHGLFRVHGKVLDAKRLLEPFNPEGGKEAVSFKVYGKGLKQAEADVVAHLQNALKVA
jgi:phosphoesterase RecJ-like protein